MKTIILLIGLSLFLSCQKETTEPQKELLNIEVWGYSNTLQTTNLTFELIGTGIAQSEQKEVTCLGSTILFKTSFYTDKQKEYTLYISGLKTMTLGVYAYTDFGHNSFKILDNSSCKIKLTDNAWKNVTIE